MLNSCTILRGENITKEIKVVKNVNSNIKYAFKFIVNV